jgi:putative SOS response-associated peptidase YedK
MSPVHDRMPVILPQSLWAEWLDPNMHDTDRLSQLLLPAADDVLTMHPVSTDVNKVSNKGKELIEPVEPAASAESDRQPTLE